MTRIIDLEQVTKSYGTGQGAVHALRGVDLSVAAGERWVITGPSGSGKSTLLHLVAGLDRPDGGRVEVAGCDLAGLDEERLAVWRRDHIGFVHQFFNLLPTLTARENVCLPLDLAGAEREGALARADALLDSVGLAARGHHLPTEMSGGEMQRVAVARALVADPRVLIADEPTGNLDSESGGAVLDLLAWASSEDRSLIMVTHDPEALRIATHRAGLRDGRLRVAP